jgi:hypothetical protein
MTGGELCVAWRMSDMRARPSVSEICPLLPNDATGFPVRASSANRR